MGAPALEKVFRMRKAIRFTMGFVLTSLLMGCGSHYLKVEDPKKLDVDDEFTKSVQIVVPDTPISTPKTETQTSAPAEEIKKTETVENTTPKASAEAKPKKGKKSAGTKHVTPVSTRHEPDMEDAEGFVARRPAKDPFWVGERVIHDVSYFKVSAGKMTFAVGDYASVNGKKAYNFVTALETYPKFSSLVYAVDDRVVTLLDFEHLIPRVFTLHVKETGQRKEARSIFDFDQLKAKYWEKKVTEEKGAQEKKMEWEILPYSQNVFSAIFYMRLFSWKMGKEYSFRVADDGENIIFKGKAVRREILDTDIGKFPAVVVKPEITVKGVFKPMGDIFIWLSDDDRHLVLRIESKIKIGTLVSEIIELDRGKPPQ